MQATVTPAATAFTPDPRNQRRVARGAWTLYDFANTIFSFAIVSGAMGLWLIDDARYGAATGQAVLALAVIVERRDQRARLAGARRALRPGRPPAAVPARVHRAVRRRRRPSSGSAAPVARAALFIVANFAYQAALIYYDASIKLVSTPATRGRLTRARDGDRVLRHRVRRAADLLLRTIPVEARFPLVGAAVRAVRDPAVRGRPRAGRARRGAADRRRRRRARWRQLADTIRHAREVPGLPRFLLGRFFYSDAGQHADRRDERGRGRGGGPDDDRRTSSCCR